MFFMLLLFRLFFRYESSCHGAAILTSPCISYAAFGIFHISFGLFRSCRKQHNFNALMTNEFPTLINWMSPFQIKRNVGGISHFIPILLGNLD